MLVLHSTSRCDVCLLEYNWETSARVPHAIACGHIFCRDCLYATIPPLCPLCRKLYQPAKIKKLHVDRPENVDEAREVELGKQQLELLEKLVDIWDLELLEGFISNPGPIEDGISGRGELPNPEGPIDAGSVAQRHVRISAGLELVNGGDNNDDEANEDGHTREENALQLDRGDVEQILDGIAGAAGVGRGFLERWGSELGNNGSEGGPIVTIREARRAHYEDVMRQVDLWLESKDEETGVVLRKSRRFLTEYLAVRTALKEALTTTKSINENHSKLLAELQGLDRIQLTLEAERDEIKRYAEHMALENQELKARLQLQSSSEKHTRSRSSVLRNPLPAPPEPVATEHLPTFAQAISEESTSAPGSVYSGSIYSPASGPAFGVRFATPSPSSTRVRERYNPGSEELASPDGNSSKSGRRKGKRRDSSHSYSYRDDSGYFDGENYFREPSSSSAMYPTSAPAVVDGYSSSSHPRNAGINSTFPNTQSVYNMTYDLGQSKGVQSRDQGYATRSTGLQVDLNASQPVDAFTLTSAYLMEYSAGYLNGQEAAMGVGPFMNPSSAPAGSSRSGVKKGDSRESIIYTTESAEDEARGRTRENSTHTRPRSQSGPRSLNSRISNPQLAAILSPSHPPQPTRRHMPTVSLPSTSSHRSSPSMSSLFSVNPVHNSSGSITGTYGRVASPTSTSSSGLVPPPLLPQDPVAAAAILAERHPGRVSPSVRSQQSWGTDPSNAHSNSLIRGLRGLPNAQGDGYDSASVRTRDRMSIDFAESVRESRRESRVSDLSISSRSVRSGESARDSSPVRPVGSMVGVLPLDDQDPDSSQGVDATYTDRSGSMNVNPNSYRSSTAVDRRMASESTVRGHSSSSTPFQIQSRSQRQVSQQIRPTDAQRIAASTGWTSTQDVTHETALSHSPESERTRSSRAQNRDDRPSYNERDDRRSRRTTHRSQTAMGVSSSAQPAANSGSSWLWDSDSNVYPSPFSHSSHAPSQSYERLSPTSQPSVTQPAPPANSNPPPSSYRSHRDRDRDVERSGRSRNHVHEHGYNNTRPSLLSRDSSASFPISVESTDDERHPLTNVNGVRSRTAIHTSSGRTTRIGNSSSIHTGNMASNNAETSNPPLQSFGNALGLELNTTSNGISAPRPVSGSSTQSFLRSWSGHS